MFKMESIVETEGRGLVFAVERLGSNLLGCFSLHTSEVKVMGYKGIVGSLSPF